MTLVEDYFSHKLLDAFIWLSPQNPKPQAFPNNKMALIHILTETMHCVFLHLLALCFHVMIGELPLLSLCTH